MRYNEVMDEEICRMTETFLLMNTFKRQTTSLNGNLRFVPVFVL